MSTITTDDPGLAAPPVACRLEAAELAARAAALREDLFGHARERQELPDGVRFRFPGSDEFRDKLLAFVVAEHTCCAFFRIELAFEPGLGPIWLTLTGPAGVKEFVQQRFAGLARPSSGVAARALTDLGYRHVREHPTGKQDRVDAGLPTERG